MTHRNPRISVADPGKGFLGFAEYTCRNGSCVLSRFDRFSMAAAPDARCPVCGRPAVPAGRESAEASAN